MAAMLSEESTTPGPKHAKYKDYCVGIYGPGAGLDAWGAGDALHQVRRREEEGTPNDEGRSGEQMDSRLGYGHFLLEAVVSYSERGAQDNP